MNNNYIYISIAILVAIVVLYFFRPFETFDETVKSPNVLNIDFPKEGLVGSFITTPNSLPNVERKVTSDPTIYSLTIKNGYFKGVANKQLKTIALNDGTIVGFVFKTVNNYPTSQF